MKCNITKAKIIIAILLLSLILIPISYAKYHKKYNTQLILESTPFYFNDTASDLTLSYRSDATFEFNVLNYNGELVTEKDIGYTISWDNSTYGLIINGTAYQDTKSSINKTLKGNIKSNDKITIGLIEESERPVKETINLEICSTTPYKKCSKYKVNIISPDGFEVTGNPTKWTKDDVTLNIVPLEGNNQIEYCSFDNGENWINALAVNSLVSVCKNTYSENTTAQIKVKYYDGTVSDTVDIDITKIDKEAPVINFDKQPDNTIDETLIVTLNEDNQLLKNMTYSDDKSGIKNIETYYNDTLITNSNYFTNVGRYEIIYKAYDNVGNEKDYKREILIRFPTGGKYIVDWTKLYGDNIVKEGLATDTTLPGLYKDTEETGLDETLPFSSKYYYSGENVNNYLSFLNLEMRVLNVSVNDDIKIIAPKGAKSTDWDTRYIYDSDKYEDWTVKWINGMYIYTPEADRVFFTENDLKHIEKATFYAGRFSRNDASTIANIVNLERTANKELSNKIKEYTASFESYFAFPNVSDYIKACNDQSNIYSIRTTQTNQSSFKKNSYLKSTNEEWTLNGKRATATDNDFWISDNGNQILSKTRYYVAHYRPVMYIKSDTILSGSGTTTDPFKIEENWDWFDSQYPSTLYK